MRAEGSYDEVLELKSLLISFGDTSSGQVSKRSFHFLSFAVDRRCVARLSEDEVTQLVEVLSSDGGGAIDYRSFLYCMQSLSLWLAEERGQRERLLASRPQDHTVFYRSCLQSTNRGIYTWHIFMVFIYA